MGKPIYRLKKVFYIDPKAEFHDVPKGNYFLLLRHNPCTHIGLQTCILTVKVDGNKIYEKNAFNKNYKALSNKNNLYDDYITHISSNSFKGDKGIVYADIIGKNTMKKNWDLDGFILIPDFCDGKLDSIHNQYFANGLIK